MSDVFIGQLKEAVYLANMKLVEAGLVVLTWGNASAVSRERGIVAIKPSGVAYDKLQPEDIVLVSLETGEPLPGERLRPSSDTPTHVCLYQQLPHHRRDRPHTLAPRDELGASLPRNPVLWHDSRR